MDRLIHFRHSARFPTCKMGATLPAFLGLLWEFSEFIPVKFSTNETYYYLGTAQGKSKRVVRLAQGKERTLCPRPWSQAD